MSSLDVSQNTALTYLGCYNNQLSSLDVSKKTALQWLYCYSNQIKRLDIHLNEKMVQLVLDGNKENYATYKWDDELQIVIVDKVYEDVWSYSMTGVDGTLAVDKATVLLTSENQLAVYAEGSDSEGSKEGGSIEGAGAYEKGSQVTLTATPAEGYVFKAWTENGKEVSTEATYAFTVSEDRDLVAKFEKENGEDVLRGDCDGNGEFNRADRIYLARALAGWEGYQVPDPEVADFNGDGEVDRGDRIYLARVLAGWEGYSVE